MQTYTTISAIRHALHAHRGKTIGFVPTMGALHRGHLALIEHAQRETDAVVVSIFVNPTQFAPHEDFSQYPRTLDADQKMLESKGVLILFAPSVEEIYPSPCTTVSVNRLSHQLCGAFRPNHFQGVATICLKLFHIIEPQKAFFGLKDFQQVQIVKKMVLDLNLPVEIGEVPTVREPNGLAMSSRNRTLSPTARAKAPLLYQALLKGREGVQKREAPHTIEQRMRNTLSSGFEIQYLGVYDPLSLEPLLDLPKENAILLAGAVVLEGVRLIDNILVQ